MLATASKASDSDDGDDDGGANDGEDGNEDHDSRPTFSSREEYLADPAFAENMECFILRADLWKVLCDTITGGRCLSEMAEVVVMKSDHPGEMKQSYGYSESAQQRQQQRVAPLRRVRWFTFFASRVSGVVCVAV